jgi:hypothetical protein
MSNPFSTDALVPVWKTASEILKYELAGHAFNGNQYTKEKAIADIREGRSMLESALAKGFDGDPSHGSLSDDYHMLDAHSALARGHAFFGSKVPDILEDWKHSLVAELAHKIELRRVLYAPDGDDIARNTKTLIAASKDALP